MKIYSFFFYIKKYYIFKNIFYRGTFLKYPVSLSFFPVYDSDFSKKFHISLENVFVFILQLGNPTTDSFRSRDKLKYLMLSNCPVKMILIG